MKAKPYLQEIQLRPDLILSPDEYPFNIPALQHFQSLAFHEDVTFIIGENGAGKSTLIEAIALHLGFGPEGGTKNVQFKTHENTSSFHTCLKSTRSFKKTADSYFLRAESFYNVATYLEQTGYLQGYGGKSLHTYSHGEAFMVTLTQKLKGNGLYIFDEPEAALSPSRQLSALAVIHQLVKNNSQFIISTHSPILLAYPNALIYQMDGEGIRKVTYQETAPYQITRDFLNNHQHLTRILLEE